MTYSTVWCSSTPFSHCSPLHHRPSTRGAKHSVRRPAAVQRVTLTFQPHRRRPRPQRANGRESGWTRQIACRRSAPTLSPVPEADRTPVSSRGRRGGRKRVRPRRKRGGRDWRRHSDNTSDRLLIGQLNIQSIKPKIVDLRSDLPDYQFDILALCETWLTPNVLNRLLNIDGYRLYRCDRSDTRGLAKGHGGVAILIRDMYHVEVLKTPVTGVRNSKLEVIWAKVNVGKCRGILFASVYRVPTNTSTQVNADLEDLECQVQYMFANHAGAMLVIAGDLNCCQFKSAADSPGQRLRRLLTTYGMTVSNIRHPTYRPAGTLLDIVAIS